MEQSFPEGIFVSGVACGSSLLPAQVLVALLQICTELSQTRPPRLLMFTNEAGEKHNKYKWLKKSFTIYRQLQLIYGLVKSSDICSV